MKSQRKEEGGLIIITFHIVGHFRNIYIRAHIEDFQTHVPRASLKTFHQKGRRGSGSGSQNRELGKVGLGHSLCMINT